MTASRRPRSRKHHRWILAAAGHLAMAGALAAVWSGSGANDPPAQGVSAATVAHEGARGSGSIEVRVRPPHDLEGLDGSREMRVIMPAGSTAGELQARLGQMYPELTPMMPYLFIAVGDEMQSSALVLSDGDAIELIAPMAGG